MWFVDVDGYGRSRCEDLIGLAVKAFSSWSARSNQRAPDEFQQRLPDGVEKGAWYAADFCEIDEFLIVHFRQRRLMPR